MLLPRHRRKDSRPRSQKLGESMLTAWAKIWSKHLQGQISNEGIRAACSKFAAQAATKVRSRSSEEVCGTPSSPPGAWPLSWLQLQAPTERCGRVFSHRLQFHLRRRNESFSAMIRLATIQLSSGGHRSKQASERASCCHTTKDPPTSAERGSDWIEDLPGAAGRR